MSDELILIFCLMVALGFALLSRRIERTVLTLPIVFAVLGYLVFLTTEHMFEQQSVRELAKLVAEVTLILILFADASHVRFAKLRSGYDIPLRMLLIGMPLTILLGTIIARFVAPELGWPLALLVAAILTPTDAALGQSVVSSADVPAQLSQAINVESGLNDGFALPVILLAAGMAGMGYAAHAEGSLLEITLVPIVLGPLAGIALGWAAAKLLDIAHQRESISLSFEGIYFLLCAFISFVLAEAIGGNGFLAAFVGGMVFGNYLQSDISFIGEFMEGQGQIMTMASFFVFGLALVPQGLEHVNAVTLSLSVLFLTVVRMLPIFISLSGLGLDYREKLFLGWFGPRGLASILFALLIVEEYDIAGKEDVLACVVLTVLLSIILHGATSAPLARLMGKLSCSVQAESNCAISPGTDRISPDWWHCSTRSCCL